MYKDLYLHNQNNSRHVIYPKILVVALSVSNVKNTKARVKIEEEGIAIFGTNISRKKRNRERDFMKGSLSGWMKSLRLCSFSSLLPQKTSIPFHHLDIFYPVPCAFSNCLSSIFYELAYIGSMPPREYFLQRTNASYASIKMRGRDKGPPFLADTYFHRRRFRASFHP